MSNHILIRIMKWRADVYRGSAVERDGLTGCVYEKIAQEIPCRLSQGISSNVNLNAVEQDDMAQLKSVCKGFFPWETDICSGDRLAVHYAGKTVGEYSVGEVFDYAGSHRECRLTKVEVI